MNITSDQKQAGMRAPLTNDYVRDYYNDYLEKNTKSYRDARWFSSEPTRFDYEQTKRAILGALENKRYATALEIGPGDGAWTPFFAKCSDSLTLLEQSDQMKERVEQLIKDESLSNVTVIRGSFPKDAPSQTYDLIASIRAFEYFEDKPLALRTFASLLAPNGRMIIVTKDPRYITLRGKPQRTLHDGQVTPAEFIQLATAAGLRVESHYPATMRWKSSMKLSRVFFHALHSIVVRLKTGIIAPIFAQYASESYLYLLTKAGD
ncbi:MAG: class I SAM-dependent methyltransferase [Candidatus Pacebacteria bacterium]|nr:class I SAM-dependent methyltransferase [Candidatus Paceibacterota bacterium]